MGGQPTLVPESGPGWFGKLPGIGDFAARRLPTSFQRTWDGWLQEGLSGLRLRRADWLERYLNGPVWRFVLASRVMAQEPWVGILMPSVDSVGRYFPLTVTSPWAGSLAASSPALWWDAFEPAVLAGLEQDLDAGSFDALLLQHGADRSVLTSASPQWTWPAPGYSLWLSGERCLQFWGLPRAQDFDGLFDGAAEDVVVGEAGHG